MLRGDVGEGAEVRGFEDVDAGEVLGESRRAVGDAGRGLRAAVATSPRSAVMGALPRGWTALASRMT